MNFEYLWSEEDIYKGNQIVIVKLLNDIQKAYNFEIENNMTNRSRSSI